MWLFLVTEVLFFSGLFVAYAVYRSNHPEVFLDAHQYLNTSLGALNTVVLLLSSLTMAWSVRCAQIGERRRLVLLLAITLACASFFLGVKAVEYSHKWNEGLLWAGAYSAGQQEHADHASGSWKPLAVLTAPAAITVGFAALMLAIYRKQKTGVASRFWLAVLVAAASYFGGLGIGYAVEHATSSDTAPHADNHIEEATTELPSLTGEQVDGEQQRFIGVFFSIYFAMTGVHAIHILAGMGAIAWLMLRAMHGEFGPDYFGPVDFVGLYWHLVDLVWIYLFPLLYLIR